MSQYTTLVQQRPPPGSTVNIINGQMVASGPQIIRTITYKAPQMASPPLTSPQRNGVKIIQQGQPVQGQHFQYQLQQPQANQHVVTQLSPPPHQQMQHVQTIVEPGGVYQSGGQRGQILIETSTHQPIAQQIVLKQEVVTPQPPQPSTTVTSVAQPAPHPSQNAILPNGTLLTEIKTEPAAFSPSSPSSGGPVASPIQPSHQTSTQSSSPDWRQQQQNFQNQNSQDGQQSHESMLNKAKGKGPVPKPQEELCLVCADRASGYHYNALACEGCKGFFRRSITRNLGNEYTCKYGGACEIDMYMRRKCKACRLRKCYAVGMKPECVIPEKQCITKREEKKKKDALKKATSDHIGGLNSPEAKRPRLSCQDERQVIPRALLPEEEELINRLVFFQREFEHPSANDLSKIYHVPLNGSSTSESEQLFRHMTEMTILTVQLIVDFSKHLPGFQTLCRDDQVVLLKGCSSEVMMLRGARKYDPTTDSIIFATNHPFTKENYMKAGLESEELFRFCRRMTNMKVDNAEFALVTAIDIFSERHGLFEPKRVEKIQEIYVDALHSYVMANRKSSPMVMFSKLLSVLTELRTLGYNNSRMCIELRMEKNKKLPDFLEEIWDLV